MPKTLLTYTHKDSVICVRRHWNKTLLLINGAVADTWRGIVEVYYALHGRIDNDEIVAELTPRPFGSVMTLKINGEDVTDRWKA